MVEAADPGDGALDAHAEAGVGDAAVAAQVEVPLEGGEREVVLFDAGLEEVVAVDALRAADDFAVALGGEDVDAESLGGVVRVGLHVEGLDGGGVAVDHDRLVELRADVGFVGGAEVVAVVVGVFEFAGFVGLLEHGVGFVVGEAREAVAVLVAERLSAIGWAGGFGVLRLRALRFAQDDGLFSVATVLAAGAGQDDG